MRNIVNLSATLVALMLGSATAASAHAAFAVGEAPAESYYTGELRIPHGCDGEATTGISVKIPEGFILARPKLKPGWQIEIIKGDYQKTYDNHGKPVTSGPVEIRWTGGNVPDDYFDSIEINGKISGVEAGAILPFVTTQTCTAGRSVVWADLAKTGENPHDLKNPAPILTITAAQGHEHAAMSGMGNMGNMADMPGMENMAGMENMQGMAGMSSAPAGVEKAAGRAGDIEVVDGFLKGMLPGQAVGGGFVTLKNDGDADDRLVSVSSPIADHVEIHEMTMSGSVMKMRPMKDGVPVPAGSSVELKPGGMHLMLMGVKSPIKTGDEVKVTFTFEKAGAIEVVLPAVDPRAVAQGMHKHK